MPIDQLAGRRYGPASYSTSRAVVDRYITATGDDPDRWRTAAPTSLAGALLFTVTPGLLADPDLAGAGTSVIHGEQTFVWNAPIPLEAQLHVTGEVTRVRERGNVHFVGFELVAESKAGPVLTGSSLFLMSGDTPPAGVADEETEPGPLEGSGKSPVEAPPHVEATDGVVRSASRSDLVRYAGASQDFNPIHWDHGAAVAAGLPGVVVHGLLQSAWLCQAVEGRGASLGSARFRYRSPLRPAVTVRAMVANTEKGWEARLVAAGGIEHVSAVFTERA